MKIALAFLARNIAWNVDNLFRFYQSLVNSQYKNPNIPIDVFVRENDSVDGTLSKLSPLFPNSKFICGDLGVSINPDSSRDRSEFMADRRNELFNAIDKDKYDYIIVFDSDLKEFPTDLAVYSAIRYLTENEDVGCISSMGLSILISESTGEETEIYYDIWSLVLNGKLQTNKIRVASRFSFLPFIEVDSAFGGLAIYKTKAIKNCKYSCISLPEEKTGNLLPCSEHVNFNLDMKDDGYRILIDSNLKLLNEINNIKI